MSNLATLARPYAKAAFGLARSADDLAGWEAALSTAALIVDEPTVARVLTNPQVSRSDAVGLIADALGDGADETFRGFLSVLAENDRLPLLPEVAALFAQLRQEHEQRLSVRVVSAVALDDEQAARLKAALHKRFNREIDMQCDTDPAVMGGAVVYAGDEVIDGSLRGRLQKLQSGLS
ncbi:MAG: F0F1 ATP synthase subunit delta [Xanthomonadales bacterium]|nr:F0F1 ATP synthase subunit delta [Xanthomonadales bacterium]